VEKLMRALHLESRPSGHGFVLVGVVMFVLALTILGLSLYGLSTYEGQFFTDTQSEEQALFQAEAGWRGGNPDPLPARRPNRPRATRISHATALRVGARGPALRR
jgi:hypothetical protein